MARTDAPPQFLDSLTPQLSQFVASNATDSFAPAETLWIGESFQVWAVMLEELLRGANEPLSRRAHWTGVWHLQLRKTAEGPGFAFARWRESEGEVDLRSFHVSPLAHEIDKAIQWIDESLPDDDSLVRLLEIPDQQLPMLWLENGVESRFRILLEEDRRYKRGLRAEPVYSEEELRGQLQSATPIRGLDVP